MKTVYISIPFEKTNYSEGLNKALEIAKELLDLGFAPFIPQFYYHIKPYGIELTKWMESSLEFLGYCDAILKLPGIADIADVEIKYAKELEIPDFDSISSLALHFNIPYNSKKKFLNGLNEEVFGTKDYSNYFSENQLYALQLRISSSRKSSSSLVKLYYHKKNWENAAIKQQGFKIIMLEQEFYELTNSGELGKIEKLYYWLSSDGYFNEIKENINLNEYQLLFKF